MPYSSFFRWVVLALLILTGPLLLCGISGCAKGTNHPRLVESFIINLSDSGFSREVEFDQAPGQALVVVVHSSEAELSLRAAMAPGTDFSRVRVPYLRNVRLVQPIRATNVLKTLRIILEPVHRTKNAVAEIDILEITSDERIRAKQLAAYDLVSAALQETDSESPDVWKPRAMNLLRASQMFEGMEMLEDALWSKLIAAYLLYYPIYDYEQAIHLSSAVYDEAVSAGLDRVALAAKQNLAFTLLERSDADPPAVAQAKQLEAQLAFDEAAQLAQRLDMPFEEAWAINGKGIGYFYQDHHEEALEQYDAALPLAIALEDPYFINQVRANRALVLEKLGRDYEALETLQEIEGSFTQKSDRNLVIDNLAEQGRILKNLYLFPESVEVLSRALQIARAANAINAEGRLQVNLARAYYEMGLMERAEQILTDALPVLHQSNNGRGLREYHQVMANIHRLRGSYDLMQQSRAGQSDYLLSDRDRAYYLLDHATDLQISKLDAELAEDLLLESLELTRGLDDGLVERRLRLSLCLNELHYSTDPSRCPLEALNGDYRALVESAQPQVALGGAEAWSAILTMLGRPEEARDVLDELIRQIGFYRENLPGVLGAWYWERRRPIFDAAMSLAFSGDLERGDGARSLLLFERLRNADLTRSSAERKGANAALHVDRVRNIIAQRARATSPEVAETLEREYDALLLQVGAAPFETRVLDEPGLQKLLSGLPADASILAYYFGEQGAYAWVADRQGVTLRPLGSSPGGSQLLTDARLALQARDLASADTALRAAGEWLVQPLDPLGETIYLLSAGPLNGFPFDALIVGGRSLTEDSRVLQLMSLEALELQFEWNRAPERVFVAGDPTDGSGGYAQLPATGAEVRYVASAFPGAVTTIRRGPEMTLATFASVEFTNADLIHIASHASLDLTYPSLSSIMLSGSSEIDGNLLTPTDIESSSLSAALVVLSACETSGSSQFSYDANLGFVSTFLAAGARSVIASLWPVPDRATAEFMQDFYEGLAHGQAPVAALQNSKKAWIAKHAGDGRPVWSAFQLYQN